MIHASLFSGIDGPAVAADAMGWETVFHCEIEPFGQMVLKDKWPNAELYENIKHTDFTIWRGKIDVLTGGFPCQPYSAAGKRKGTEDNRHLWPEMLRAVREIKPRWVIPENVSGIISWNGGMVFNEVQTQLENEGYEVLPVLLPAVSVNAPHRRDRIFFVAHSKKCGNSRKPRESEGEGDKKRVQKRNQIHLIGKSGNLRNPTHAVSKRDTPPKKSRETEIERSQGITGTGKRGSGSQRANGLSGLQGNAANAFGKGSQRSKRSGEYQEKNRTGKTGAHGPVAQLCTGKNWQNFPTQSPVCSGNDGLPLRSLRQRICADSMGLLSEKEIDTILSKAASKWRKETIKAAGNAIVPQVMLQLFKTIDQYEKLLNHER